MTKLRVLKNVLPLLFLSLILTTSQSYASGQNVQVSKKADLTAAKLEKELICVNNKSSQSIKKVSPVSYKIIKDTAVVYINNKEVVKYTHSLDGVSIADRAKITAARINEVLNSKINPKNILPAAGANCTTVRAGNILILTADVQSAKDNHMWTSGLATMWANNIRQALGAPRISRDTTKVASRGFSRSMSRELPAKYMGKTEVGMASWYGGRFHGRRAADGSRFDMNQFTAAHKKLPFGTIVKVTNLRNNKTCFVEITDRGPFVRGRVIDLSRAAASEIGIVSTGISHVKLEVVGKTR